MASGALRAQEPAVAQQLGAVTVVGASRLSDADVVRLSALTTGQPIAPADLDVVVRRLAATGLFASVRYRSRMYLTELADGTLRTMYRRKGFRRAAFGTPVATVGAPPEACAGVSVTLPVSEGVAHEWGGADWSGASVLTTRELDRLLGLRTGEVADVARSRPGCGAWRAPTGSAGSCSSARSGVLCLTMRRGG
jgi:outer membrane protein assembly factor BamA